LPNPEFRDSEYLDDDGVPWLLRVRAEYALDVNRGPWVAAPPGLPPFPRLRRARRVVGIDPLGRVQYAIAASLNAPIWTGAVTAFVFRAGDGFTYAAIITGRQGERRSR
jgi:hypothetical protein